MVAKADIGYGGIEGNQEYLDYLFDLTSAEEKHDEACKDPSRACFLTTESDILYLSDELFTYSNPAFSEQPSLSGSAAPVAALPSVPSGSAAGLIPLASLIPLVENLASKASSLGNALGNHNNTLYRVAAYMRAYHDDEQWLLQNLPRYNQSDSESHATVHSACQAEIPRVAKTLIAKALKELNQQQNRSALAKSNDLCPQLPADLPST